MRILVLGGTAFLSAEIARQALEAGHDVTCLGRGTSAPPPAGARWVQADRSAGTSAYAGAADGRWDAVVEVSRDPDQARDALDVLAGSTGHWTFISSCSVYADSSVARAGEDAELLPPLAAGTGLTVDNYGEAKASIEHWTRKLAGDKAHICRPGLIGGPGDTSDRYGYWPARFARDQEPVLIPDIPWLPPGQEGFMARSNDAARAAGLQLRPWMDTVRDALADERRRGLGRERKAGLSPETERRLLREYRAGAT